MADMFIADVTVWAWASGVAGPGYVIVRQQDVGQDGDSLEERRLNLPRGLTGGDFRISKQEVPDWKSMSNEIKFYWNPQKGWITIGVFKVQRHRNCMQFGFRMLNLMMLLGVAARRTDRPSNMFECLSLGARKRWSRDRERHNNAGSPFRVRKPSDAGILELGVANQCHSGREECGCWCGTPGIGGSSRNARTENVPCSECHSKSRFGCPHGTSPKIRIPSNHRRRVGGNDRPAKRTVRMRGNHVRN